jgi:hypothetical protein
MKGEVPVVIRGPYRLARPFSLFPPRIDRDWPEILSRIPRGHGLKVPVSHGTVAMALTHLTKRGLLKRYEYVVNRTGKGQCIIYHVRLFLGEPFRIQPRSRRKRISSTRWDQILRQVMSGKTVTVDAPYTVVYQAIYRRISATQTPMSSIIFEKISKNGKERMRLRKK